MNFCSREDDIHVLLRPSDQENGESVCGIKDIQIGLTPLEEVYMNVVRLSKG
jgi:hypothetical protein